MGRGRNAEALERFERTAALPMLVLSLAIIPLLLAPVIFDLSPGVEQTLVALDWMVWAAFAAEYIIRLFLAPHKGRFVRTNKLDLFLIALPFLRPVRVVRSARMLRTLRAGRAVAFFARGINAGRDILTRHNLHYALAVTCGVVLGAALMVDSFERGSTGANITSFEDALWWAITTVTTVGYGDHYPITPAGRGVGVVLMILGIALFGFLTANLASFLVEESHEDEVDPQLAEINERLKRIEEGVKGSRP